MAKKAPAAPADSAPTWKSYLAVRSATSAASSSSSSNTTVSSLARVSRKRAQPVTAVASIAPRVRAYWERLSATERQHVLFIDDPELVKQLYKLNLSLLCVGLMQRHLKVPRKAAATAAAAAAAATTTEAAASAAAQAGSNSGASDSAAATTAVVTPAPSTATTEAKPPAASAAAAPGGDALAAEKTYELLEAMEFMDIGTGILTVKSDLVEIPERLFSLVGDVLAGFVSSVHVLSDTQFHALFVSESEVINTWEDYQRLIAMLVEQLILKSYVGHLEREAAAQMEELLLEVSLENKKPRSGGSASANARQKGAAAGGGGAAAAAGGGTGTGGGSGDVTTATATVSTPRQAVSKKKKKRKKATRDGSSSAAVDSGPSGTASSDQPEPEDFEDGDAGGSDKEQQLCSGSDRHTASSEEDMELAIEQSAADDATCAVASPDSAEQASRLGNVASPEKRRRDQSAPKRGAPSSLNPNALAFEPLRGFGSVVPTPRYPPLGAKRKLDAFVVSVFAEDALSDDEFLWGDDGYDSDDAGPALLLRSAEPPRRQKVARWREEDAALEWQLQQIYAAMSTTHGWDFTNQREVVAEQPQAEVAVPWDDLALWRTAPTEVVRYFGAGAANGGFGPFYASQPGSYPFAAAAATGAALSSQQPESRYYFAPPSPLALSSAYLPPTASQSSSSSSASRSGDSGVSPLLLPAPVPTSAPAPAATSSLSSRRRGYRS